LRRVGIEIGDNNLFHGRLRNYTIDLTRPSLVTMGSNISFNDGFALFTHGGGTHVLTNYYKDFIPSSGKVTLGNNIAFGRNVTILKGVSIGDNCIIGNGSVITKSIPSNSVAAGVPAKVYCTLDEYYEKRKALCIEEALEYAKSIKDRFGRKPKIKDFWEEFPLFLNGDENVPDLPIRRQLGSAYEEYKKTHRAIFNGFEDFLKRAKL